jgi:ABC-type transporter MlaC component
LGRQWRAADAAGSNQFLDLVPSIIVSEFFGRLSNVGNVSPVVDPNLVPKGSTRAGVRTQIGRMNLLITVNKANSKIYDVEYMGHSLMNDKRNEFQRSLSGFQQRGPQPVAALVNYLINSGKLVKCN